LIETPLAILPLDRSFQEICDWFEFHVLSSEYHCASFSELARIWDKRRNSENTDFEDSGNTQEEFFLEEVNQIIRERITFLGDCYPFKFSENDEELIYDKDNLNAGSIIYLFCLFLSNKNKADIFDDDSFFEIDNKIRDLFQACATWAAAGEVDGHAYSFGFPRTDHSGFLVKLRAIYQHFSDGKVRNSPLPGVPISPKDEEIDIIAWRPREDGAPGTYYLLGQVASGGNWEAKSITGAICAFHRNWFDTLPASNPSPAMFIPFNIIPTKEETLQEKISFLTPRYGIIFYRYRIPLIAKKGLEISHTKKSLVIERTTEISKIADWVSEAIDNFRKSCVYS